MKIALIGYGKMGKAIDTLLQEQYGSKHTVVLRINSENRHNLTPEMLRQADVAIEFTIPDAAPDNLSLCFEAGIPVVCGTTGWLDCANEVFENCRRYSGALVYAANFSVGVNLFFELNRYLAQLMQAHPEYAVGIEEIHHKYKLDSPSGTAITLAQAIIQENKALTKWVNQAATQPNELSIVSKRLEDVSGTHIVTYQSAIDSIEIKHTAHNRFGFAAGAVLAAEWVVGKTGIFSMREVLQFANNGE